MIQKKLEFEYPYTILNVERHNYNVLQLGDWHTIEYNIYFDGSYIINIFTLDIDINNPKFYKSISGKLNFFKFKKLQRLLNYKNWDNTKRKTKSKDDIWKIGYFSNGKLIESMGDINIKNDDKILNKIVSCLPKDKLFMRKEKLL